MKLTRAVSIVLTAGAMVAGLTACQKAPVPGTPSPDASSAITGVTHPATSPAAGPVSTTAPRAAAVPTAAWVHSNRLPLDDAEHWPNLADSAEPLGNNTFQTSSLCAGTPTQVGGSENARALIDRGAGNWSVQQVLVHYPGDPWTMGQTAHAMFNELQNTLKGCQNSSSGASLTLTTPPNSACPSVERGGCNQVAAEVHSPQGDVTAHIYLAAVGSTVTELSLWSTGTPTAQWPEPADEDVFAAMNPQLCSVWEC
ncbi:hypothetical protein [Mycolicibacterium fortuitum]|uniref:hypothetical protein n=1 Tax=Mycolicibacterium fortuitum TaxID=1766 RepID=UPI001042388B|nr:hypothetical protein [Mycolicibacterium fortuitum]NOQ58536.1 hypothetical protein [Mycolicibacterium fortuitum]NOR01503.1 hypothetical protein [Mycolicibacterium fortuitum]